MVIKFCNIKQLDKCIGKRKIIAFGVSDMAKEFIDTSSLKEQLDFFVDNNTTLVGTYIENGRNKWKICDFEELRDIHAESYVVLIFSRSYTDIIRQCNLLDNLCQMECYIYPLISINWEEIYDTEQWKYERIYNAVENNYKKMLRLFSYSLSETEKILANKRVQMLLERKLIVPQVNFLVTTRCTLRCKDCIGLIPYIKGHHEDKESVLTDIKNFVRGIDECVIAEIGGGEPFLYPFMADILSCLISESKITYIRIPTNGTVIPNENITVLLKNPKVSLYISYYGFDKTTQRFIDYVNQNDIVYIFDKDKKWIESGGVEKRKKMELQKMVEYYRCSAGKMCKTIYRGRIYHCARAARMLSIDETIEDDSMKLQEEWTIEKMREQVRAFFLKKVTTACDYCDLAKIDASIIDAGIQLNLSEK